MKRIVSMGICVAILLVIVASGCTSNDDDEEEEEERIKITFGTPVFATKTSDNYYMWSVDAYPEKSIYEIEVKPITTDCLASYMGSNVISLAHPVVQGKYVYEISFTIEFVREEQDYSQDYTLTCEV